MKQIYKGQWYFLAFSMNIQRAPSLAETTLTFPQEELRLRFEVVEDGLGEDLAGSAKQTNATIVFTEGVASLLMKWDE